MSIWNTDESIESELNAALEALCAGVPTAEEIIAATGAEVVEYQEKHFDGPAMSDDEWSTL